MIIMQDLDYKIEFNIHLFLIHSVRRPDINSVSDVLVGEATWTRNNVWEVRIGNEMLLVTSSPTKALEVLWEQRNHTFRGYLQ